MGSITSMQIVELLLLWLALSAVIVLAARRRKQNSLPWAGVGFSAAGILLLACHAMRIPITGFLEHAEFAWFTQAGSESIWRWVELTGLVAVGGGVIVLTYIADEEHRRRINEQRLAQIAPDLKASPNLLKSILRTAPGATILLRAAAPPSSGYAVAFADEKALAVLESPPSNHSRTELPLGLFKPSSLVAAIRAAADEAISTNAMVKREIEDPRHNRWHEISVGSHGAAVIVMLSDITERRQAAIALERAAFTDPVTGLANRRYFEERLESAVVNARARAAEAFALVYLDFDHFKSINDEHGHHTGDELLISIGARISATIDRFEGENGRAHLAARIGGDEFVILLRENDQSRVRSLAETLRHELCAPHALTDVTVTSTASVGVAMCDGRQVSGTELLKDADGAMYAAKQGGKNRVHVFSPDAPPSRQAA